MELLRRALETFYVELPAIQAAAFHGLGYAGIHVSEIEFVPPDEPEQEHSAYTMALEEVMGRRQLLAGNFSEFAKALSE
jgi:hypothetical protein